MSETSDDSILPIDDTTVHLLNGTDGNNCLITQTSDCERTPLRRRRTLNKYGGDSEPPKDDGIFYVNDDNYGCCAVGRDYEPIYVPHKYTEEEKKTLASFESLDYLPPDTQVYKQWIKQQKVSMLQLDRWLMMGLIGCVVGIIGFLLHQLIEQIAEFKREYTQEFFMGSKMIMAWLFAVGYSVAFVLFSAAVIVFWRPIAGGSGIPEVTGFLNGTHMRHIFSIKSMVAKFFSCVTAIGCGMPVGPEGPMIHLGALVGAGVSQTKSETLRFKLPFFQRFRNSEDRRNFISAGAAAGVASAFGAPVGGLLFSMEEVSSFWTTTLSWQIFFCCIVSTFTTDLLNSAFHGFKYTGNFGQFKTQRYILFNIDQGVDVNILMFIPTVIIGVIGGILGSLFVVINLKVARTRKRILARLKDKWKQTVFRLIEPVLIMVIVSTISIFLPSAFPCVKENSTSPGVTSSCPNTTDSNNVDFKLTVAYTCNNELLKDSVDGVKNRSYSEMATLLYGTTESAVKILFSRNTHVRFDFASLSMALVFYFFFVCWSCATSVAGGILVPMLLIGSLYGRMIGLLMVTIFGVHLDKDSYWRWMDPGAFALIGAASFFGGVTRLTMAVTVIMMELTNDVQVLLPVMVAVMVAKWVGDFFTHPMFHALLELKCIPFLDPEPKVTVMGRYIKLNLHTARDIMSFPVMTLHDKEQVRKLADILLHTSHGGFPVVRQIESGLKVFLGIITRLELTVILMKEELFLDGLPIDKDYIDQELSWVEYEELLIDKISDPEQKTDRLQQYLDDIEYQDKYIDLMPYINQSAFSIPERFSLQRTYLIFRTLGMRHLTVVNHQNEVIGIITRKDLMGFNLVNRLGKCLQEEMAKESRNIEMNHTAVFI